MLISKKQLYLQIQIKNIFNNNQILSKMKKIIIIPFLLLTASILFAQEQNASFFNKKNEVKINLPISIFAEFIDVSYERVLKEDISVGSSLGFSLNDGGYFGLNFQVAPYFRWFFGGNSKSANKYAAGFFVEANSSILSKNIKRYNDNGVSNTDAELGAGIGVGIGWKYVSKNNWCAEILFGGGRDFINDGGYPRIGLSIGKRF